MGMALTIIGTAVSALGAFQQASAAQAQARYNAQVAENNAVIADQNRRNVVERGREAVREQRERLRITLGAVRSRVAGMGLVVDEQGTTPDDLYLGMVERGELDIMKIRANVERQAREAEIQGINFRAQAIGEEARAASINPGLAALSAGLGTFRSSGGLDLIGGFAKASA